MTIYLERTFLNTFKVVKNKFSGEIELDESYFGTKRIRGKRGRGAAGKTPVFNLLKRNGAVYAEIVENCSKKQLMPIIKRQILGNSIFIRMVGKLMTA